MLLPNSPIPAKIPPSTSNRLPSNIPLRTLPAHALRHDHERQSTSLLGSPGYQDDSPPIHGSRRRTAPHHHGYAADEDGSDAGHPRSSADADDAASDFTSDSWTDTGDIAEQLGEEDPLRKRLGDRLDDEILAGALRRDHARKQTKRVRYQRDLPHHHGRDRPSTRSGVLAKEAISIPDAAPHRPSRVERWLASIMSGGASSIHGLTGKPLMYAL